MPSPWRLVHDQHIYSERDRRLAEAAKAQASRTKFSARPQPSDSGSSSAEPGEAGDSLKGSKGLGDLAGPLEPKAAYEAADRKLRRSVGAEPATNTSNFNRREPT